MGRTFTCIRPRVQPSFYGRLACLFTELVSVIRTQRIARFIPMKCLIKPLGLNTAFRPDIVILDRTALANEPLWKTEPVITLGNSVKLVVEVVSTNWQNDYARKVEDYEALGISEYWIVDYLGLGGKRYIGSPKQPVITIYQLVEGTYQGQQFRKSDRLISQTFPDLNLTAEQIVAAGQ